MHINLGKTKDLVLMYGLQDIMQITPRHGQSRSGQWRLGDIEDAYLATATALALVHFRHSHSHSQMVTTMWPQKPLRYSSSRSMHSHFRRAATSPPPPPPPTPHPTPTPTPPTHLVCNAHLIANFLSFHMSLVVVMN